VPKKTTIVLADEQTLFREGLAAIFEHTPHYRVAGQCGDGLAAAKLIETLSPDVAVLDLGLPKLHAFGVIQKARRLDRSPRFLVVSSRCDRLTVLDALRAGANGYILRTDPASALLRGVHDIVAGSIYVSPQLKLADVFRGPSSISSRESYERLSPREFQVFMLLMQGLRGKEIANQLNLNAKTVSTYRVNLMNKLSIYDVPGLVRYALHKKLISLR
jgi:DNA-binding NarL/FixJ family response regulator